MFCSFEKMISGMYLGEIVRLAIVDMTSNNILFNGKISTKMKTKNAFSTSFISDIERYVLKFKHIIIYSVFILIKVKNSLLKIC